MNRIKFRIGTIDVILLVISLVFLLGILFVFNPCAAMEDGSWMTCHWAGNAVTGLAAVLVAISLMHLCIPVRQIKAGLSLAMIPVSILAYLIPGRVIGMCMMRDMRCHTTMSPAVKICSVLLIAAAVIDILIQGKKGKE